VFPNIDSYTTMALIEDLPPPFPATPEIDPPRTPAQRSLPPVRSVGSGDTCRPPSQRARPGHSQRRPGPRSL